MKTENCFQNEEQMDDGRRRGTGGFRAASSFPLRGSTITAILWPLPHALVVVSVVIAVTIAVGCFVSGSGVGSVSSNSRRRCCAATGRNASVHSLGPWKNSMQMQSPPSAHTG
jgi:hypothetical protein